MNRKLLPKSLKPYAMLLAGLASGIVFLYLPTKRTLDRRNVLLIKAVNKAFSLADTQPIEVK